MSAIKKIIELCLVISSLAVFCLPYVYGQSSDTPASLKLGNEKPQYPGMSKRLNEQGTVILRVLVKSDGSVGSINIKSSSGFPRIDKAAEDAVWRWKFNPAVKDGKPIDEWYQVPITMKLQGGEEEVSDSVYPFLSIEDAKRYREERAIIRRDREQLAEERRRIDDERRRVELGIREREVKLIEEHRRLEEATLQHEKQRRNGRIELKVTHTQPSADGSITIDVLTNTDTASLLVNGSEEGGRADGKYTIRRIARVGQETKFSIVAKDIYGNTSMKTITVSRAITDSSPRFDALNPIKIKTRQSVDAVAIIIGIQNYKRLPDAEYANEDARSFYDYAIRALGIKPENIKILIDEKADQVEILGAFQSWLPVKVKKSKTDVYVFYSGHGLPSEDGKNLYILPYGADKQFIDKTGLNQQEIIRSLQSVQAKSVTMFMDACYSGQIRTGDTLLANARPVSLKTSANLFPPEFTVFSASSPEQIASSSPALKHGIFSYYVMKGMEGDADENEDGKITIDELHSYLAEMVSRQALSLNRKQNPQLIGVSGKALVK